MSDSVLNCTVDMYADDTLIYVCDKDVNVIEKCLNDDLKCISNWLQNNLMKANVSKTKLMILGTPAKLNHVDAINVMMNSNAVDRV